MKVTMRIDQKKIAWLWADEYLPVLVSATHNVNGHQIELGSSHVLDVCIAAAIKYRCNSYPPTLWSVDPGRSQFEDKHTKRRRRGRWERIEEFWGRGSQIPQNYWERGRRFSCGGVFNLHETASQGRPHPPYAQWYASINLQVTFCSCPISAANRWTLLRSLELDVKAP